MLDDNIKTILMDKAKKLLAEGIRLSVPEGSALDDLKTQLDLYPPQTEEGEIFSESEESHEVFKNKVDGYSEGLAQIVNNQIQIVRTQVKPLVKDLDDQITAAIDEVNELTAYQDVNLVYCTVPTFAQQGRFLAMIEDFDGGEYPAPKGLNLNMEEVDQTSLVAMAMTGLTDIDRETVTHFESVDPMILEGLFTAVYTGRRAQSAIEDYAPDCIFDKVTYYAYGVLTSYGLMEDVKAGVEMSLKEYRGALQAIYNYCAARLALVLHRIESETKSKVLITHMDKQKKITYVNKAVYDEYIQGRTNDALYGAIISNRPPRTLNQITSRQAELEREWHNFSSLFEMQKKRRLLEVVKTRILSFMIEGLKQELTEIEKDYMQTHDTHRDTVMSKTNRFVEKLTTGQLDDVTQLSIDVVAGCRFYFTDAQEVLSMIHEYTQDEEVDPRHAAAIAGARYAIKAVSKLISVK